LSIIYFQHTLRKYQTAIRLILFTSSRFFLSIIHFHNTQRKHQTDIRLILFTSSRFFSGVTDAHPLEGADVDGGVARHQAGVVAAQKVGTFLTIGIAYQTRKMYIIVFVEGLTIIRQQVKYNQSLREA
jgi:hypothetical protein